MLPALEPYTLVLLVRGERAGMPEDDAVLDELQDAHVAYIQDLIEQGKIAVSGPVVGSPDGSVRGVAVYRTSVEEAEELARRDPAVLAGRLAVQAMTWWAEKGRIGARPASAPPAPDPVLAADRTGRRPHRTDGADPDPPDPPWR